MAVHLGERKGRLCLFRRTRGWFAQSGSCCSHAGWAGGTRCPAGSSAGLEAAVQPCCAMQPCSCTTHLCRAVPRSHAAVPCRRATPRSRAVQPCSCATQPRGTMLPCHALPRSHAMSPCHAERPCRTAVPCSHAVGGTGGQVERGGGCADLPRGRGSCGCLGWGVLGCHWERRRLRKPAAPSVCCRGCRQGWVEGEPLVWGGELLRSWPQAGLQAAGSQIFLPTGFVLDPLSLLSVSA